MHSRTIRRSYHLVLSGMAKVLKLVKVLKVIKMINVMNMMEVMMVANFAEAGKHHDSTIEPSDQGATRIGGESFRQTAPCRRFAARP
jgi:hypothetical protein